MEMLRKMAEWWEPALMVLLLLLAWGGSWLLGTTLRGRIRKLREANASSTGAEILRSLVPLVRWGLFLAALALGLHIAQLPALAEAWLNAGIKAALTLLAASVAGSAVTVSLRHWSRRPGDPAVVRTRTTMAPVLAKSCQIFFYIIAGLLILQNGGYNVAGLLAGLGIGGLAVALAGKETLANLFGSIAVLVDRPFQVGDTIRQGDTEGTVERIGLRSTRVRTAEGFLVSVPNQIITTSSVTNISARLSRRQVINLGMAYTLSADQMRQAVGIVRDIFAAHSQTQDAWVYWKEFGETTLNIQAVYWSKAPDMKTFLASLEELNMEIKAKLDEAGLSFAAAPKIAPAETVSSVPVPAEQES